MGGLIVFKCASCGAVLMVLSSSETRKGIPTPSDVAMWLGWRCPRCGRRLGGGGAVRISASPAMRKR